MSTRILGLATALPEHRAPQEQIARFQARVIEASTRGEERERALALVDRVYSRSGIDSRASVIPDFTTLEPAAFRFFPPRWELEPFPTTAQRMAFYEHASVDLAERAARSALADAGVPAAAVTHLIVVSCTGFFAPGPDCVLRERLGLHARTARTIVGFQGCYAGFAGLRLAAEIARGNPAAVILLVSVELCSLHFQKQFDADILVAQSLFGDGAAAALIGTAPRGGPRQARLLAAHSLHEEDSSEAMSWRIGDHGFVMRLSGEVPRRLQDAAPAFVHGLLAEAGIGAGSPCAWAIHPGGRRIVEAIGSALRLPEDALQPSLAALSRHGNLSSAAIFSVLEGLLPALGAGEACAALGFGPGLTLEGLILRKS
jgi:predicted naringenin-chalcone synthase